MLTPVLDSLISEVGTSPSNTAQSTKSAARLAVFSRWLRTPIYLVAPVEIILRARGTNERHKGWWGKDFGERIDRPHELSLARKYAMN